MRQEASQLRKLIRHEISMNEDEHAAGYFVTHWDRATAVRDYLVAGYKEVVKIPRPQMGFSQDAHSNLEIKKQFAKRGTFLFSP